MHLLRASRLARSLRHGPQAALQRRSFVAPTPPRRVDLVQDLYLKELKSYKPTPLKPNDADAHVQKFAIPQPPRSPEETDIAKDMKAYEETPVEVEGRDEGPEEEEEDWLEKWDDNSLGDEEHH